jgi:methionyl-tRNA formyltransferase
MKANLRIVFMGTPEFAVPSLDILLQNGYEIVGVVTAPDKPSGRGLQLSPSPIKEYALSKGLPILQPEKLKNPAFLEELKELKADVQVVVAFRMLPELVWSMPPLGTFNLHASLLPQYRGAAPLNWAIINGETETGVTTFFLQHEIDTGDIILQEKEAIFPTDTIGSLYERMKHKGAALVLKTVHAIEMGELHPTAQYFNDPIKLAPKLFKEDCQIDWSKTSQQVHNLIRGLSPYPAAFFSLNDKNCKIFDSELTDIKTNNVRTNNFNTDNKSFLHVSCSDYCLNIVELQLEGKKRMKIAEFLRGTKVETVA